jgi:hypothetical protein
VVELVFDFIDTYARPALDNLWAESSIKSDDAIQELNARFNEAGVGFQYESQEIIRVDSTLLHQEAVRPALHVLRDQNYKGANEEFLNAHRHYRLGNYKESITDLPIRARQVRRMF